MIALRKRAEVDSKYLIMISPNDASELKQSLDRHAFSFNVFTRDLFFMFPLWMSVGVFL